MKPKTECFQASRWSYVTWNQSHTCFLSSFQDKVLVRNVPMHLFIQEAWSSCSHHRHPNSSLLLQPTCLNPAIPIDPANSIEHWQGFDCLQTLKPTGHHPRHLVSLAELQGLKVPASELHLLRFWCPYSGLYKPKPPECETMTLFGKRSW